MPEKPEGGQPEEMEEGVEEKETKALHETSHEPVSWSEGNKVFVTVKKDIQKPEKFAVLAEIENEQLFDEQHMPENDWVGACPTTRVVDTLEEAQKIAEDLLAEREKWMDKDFD